MGNSDHGTSYTCTSSDNESQAGVPEGLPSESLARPPPLSLYLHTQGARSLWWHVGDPPVAAEHATREVAHRP